MSEISGAPSLPVDLRELLRQRLQQPLPDTFDEGRKLLEKHLETVTGMVEEPTTPPSVSEQVAQVIQMSRYATDSVRNLTLPRSSCNEAAAAGVVFITIGAAIHPAAAVVGFMMGVEMLLESCG